MLFFKFEIYWYFKQLNKKEDGRKAAEGASPPQTRQKGICQGVPLKARRTGATLHSWTAMFR